MEQINLTFVKYESGAMAYSRDFEGCLLIAGCKDCIEASQFAKDYLGRTYGEEFSNPKLNISSCDLDIQATGEAKPKVIIDSRTMGKSQLESLISGRR